eukprot:scaffold47157_cov68-Phaeocystis_antarctica.AAC.2
MVTSSLSPRPPELSVDVPFSFRRSAASLRRSSMGVTSALIRLAETPSSSASRSMKACWSNCSVLVSSSKSNLTTSMASSSVVFPDTTGIGLLPGTSFVLSAARPGHTNPLSGHSSGNLDPVGA